MATQSQNTNIQSQSHSQGAVLSTTLFNIYINDLLQTLETSGIKVAAFADDIVIWSSRKSTLNDQLKANTKSTLITLQRWCSENLMTINIKKTSYQIFSLAKKPINITLKYNNIELQRTNKEKYLGVILDNKLSWSKHVEYVTKKVTNKFKILKRLAGTKWGSSRHTLNTTYK